MTLFPDLQRKIINKIMEVEKEASKKNWDGYDALPVNPEASNYAVRLMILFPVWIPEPDVIPESDGHIAFDWGITSKKLFSVSISPTGHLHYSGMNGKNKISGSEKIGDVFPKHIADFIKELYNL